MIQNINEQQRYTTLDKRIQEIMEESEDPLSEEWP